MKFCKKGIIFFPSLLITHYWKTHCKYNHECKGNLDVWVLGYISCFSLYPISSDKCLISMRYWGTLMLQYDRIWCMAHSMNEFLFGPKPRVQVHSHSEFVSRCTLMNVTENPKPDFEIWKKPFLWGKEISPSILPSSYLGKPSWICPATICLIFNNARRVWWLHSVAKLYPKLWSNKSSDPLFTHCYALWSWDLMQIFKCKPWVVLWSRKINSVWLAFILEGVQISCRCQTLQS